MPYSYKGSISFGFVYIPVTLYNAVKPNDIGSNMLDKKTMSRVKYIKTCVDCEDRIVKQEDIVKGYKYGDDKYVVFTDSDFEKLKTQKDKNITIEKFVDLEEIDPIYFDKPYFVVPSGADKAFSVLLYAMETLGKAAVAKTVLGAKETLIAIRAQKGQMLLNTLNFHDEIQKNPAGKADKPSEAELKLAESIIENMSGAFKPEEYRDEYRERVMQAIENKIAGKEIAAPKERAKNGITDLMEALKQSLAASQTGKTAKKRNAKPTSAAPSKQKKSRAD